MKTKSQLVMVGIASVFFTSLVWQLLIAQSKQAQRSLLESDVIHPTYLLIYDIHRDLTEGRCALARQKMNMLKENWGRFESNGPSPEIFVWDIIGKKH